MEQAPAPPSAEEQGKDRVAHDAGVTGDPSGRATGELRELTEYLVHTCFPEIAVPEGDSRPGRCRGNGDARLSVAGAVAGRGGGASGHVWEMHDGLFADQGRLEGPHLWTRAERLGLDVERFEADRRSDAVGDRVRDDFRA
jgi:hypothetical protein